MPELPDVLLYCDALRRFCQGREILNLQVRSPFVVRTFDPPIETLIGKAPHGFSRFGKRIVWEFPDRVFLVVHLMIAGRFHWKRERPSAARRGRNELVFFEFDAGCLLMTEMSKKKRASLHLIRGDDLLADFDPGGLDLLSCSYAEFEQVLARENRTIKRALTNPRWFDGVGNAYSDEILWQARISPVTWTSRLTDDQRRRLLEGARRCLSDWSERLRLQVGDRFPEKVTAFRPEMAVHGKFGQPCPRCGDPVQRIVFAENETNYCATCQNGGRVLADRSLSRLLRGDWPRTIEEWEAETGGAHRR